ncbi:guanylin [Salmo trutta]|uniref:Guanylate cyclase activator 2B n=1 Tax=Salmo trutta TaxID=8032 RepID=A0A674F7S1_SALTR|nr:guanylin-like [Salmo trutta]
MKSILSIALMVLALCLVSEALAVKVQEGDFFFSLDSVKKLQELTAEDSNVNRMQNPRLTSTSFASVCANPSLPQEFMPLCMKRGASMSLSRLAAVPMDICEICAFAACTGC